MRELTIQMSDELYACLIGYCTKFDSPKTVPEVAKYLLGIGMHECGAEAVEGVVECSCGHVGKLVEGRDDGLMACASCGNQ